MLILLLFVCPLTNFLRKILVKPFEILLRKLRTCIFISLRLDGLPLGPLPFTIANLENGKTFSMHELVARDELTITHKHAEIAKLEHACLSSAIAFDPSTSDGDDASMYQILQRSCRALATSPMDRSRAKLAAIDSNEPAPLLLFLGHFNDPAMLMAHRALLLSSMRGQQVCNYPKIDFLEDGYRILVFCKYFLISNFPSFPFLLQFFNSQNHSIS